MWQRARSPQQEPVWVEPSSSQQQWSLRSSKTGSALRFLWTMPVSSLQEVSIEGVERLPLLYCSKLLQRLKHSRNHPGQLNKHREHIPFPSTKFSASVSHRFSPPWWGVWHQRRPPPAPSFSPIPPFYSFPIWSASLTAFAWTSGRGRAHNSLISHSSRECNHSHYKR